jgi:predicted dehydrogenase
MSVDLSSLQQRWPLPSNPKPIIIIGAGGIVNDAHLPAYQQINLPVAGVFDVDQTRARATADKFHLPAAFASMSDATATRDAVFDIAVPPEFIPGILKELPSGAPVLIQKPLGKDLAAAKAIRDICVDKQLIAAVNFQLRFCPMLLALRDLLQRGAMGELLEIEFRLNIHTPWEIFPFLKKLDRVEFLVHSIHYLDFIRSIAGDPEGVYARTIKHPSHPDLASARSSVILDYGDRIRCSLSLNHTYAFGPQHQAASISVQGTKGAAMMKMGVAMSYPKGEPDEMAVTLEPGQWRDVPLVGNWFPDAFKGTMSNLQRYAAGEDDVLHTRVADAYRTMALVEACYISDATGGTPLPE